ncbi:MAG: hypothetical protein JWO53_487 [Chlamydiia bacterium]|nr:hypothetical protein [Chlamydiia bacterium]
MTLTVKTGLRTMNRFVFFRDSPEFFPNLDTRVVLVPKNIDEKHELFNLFSNSLCFPFYFGENWDALYDCLTDLNWLSEKLIVIIHTDLPFANMQKEKNIYIKLLQ